MTVGELEAVFSADTSGLSRAAKDTDAIFERIGSNYADVQKTLDRKLELGTLDGAGAVHEELAVLERGLDDVARRHEISVDAEGVTAMQNRVEGLRAELAQMDDGVRTATRSTGNFNEIIFSAGDAVQDFSYAGIRGSANNLAYMAEQLAQASQRGGGFKGTLTGLLGALAGTGGIIFAVQALIALGPKLIAFFSNSSAEAEAMAEKIVEVASDLVDLQAEIDSLSFSVRGEESIRQYATNLEEAEQRQAAFVEALREGADPGYFDKWNALFDSLGFEGDVSTLEKVNALVDNLGVSATTARRALKGFPKASQAVSDALQNSTHSLEQETRTLKGLQAESEAAQNKLAALTVTQEAAEAAMAAGAQQAKDYATAIASSDEPIQTAREGLEALTAMQSERGFSRVEALAGRVEYLRQALDMLREETTVKMDSSAVEKLRGRYESAQASLDALKESLKDTDAAQPFVEGSAALDEYRQRVRYVLEELDKLPGKLELEEIDLDVQLDTDADSIAELDSQIQALTKRRDEVEGDPAKRADIQQRIEALKQEKEKIERMAGMTKQAAKEYDRLGKIANAAIRGVSESLADSIFEAAGLNEELDTGYGILDEIGEVGVSALKAVIAEFIKARLAASAAAVAAGNFGGALDALTGGGGGLGGLIDLGGSIFGGGGGGGFPRGGGGVPSPGFGGGFPGRTFSGAFPTPSIPSAAPLTRAMPRVPSPRRSLPVQRVHVTFDEPRWDGQSLNVAIKDVQYENERLGL